MKRHAAACGSLAMAGVAALAASWIAAILDLQLEQFASTSKVAGSRLNPLHFHCSSGCLAIHIILMLGFPNPAR
jgi:hypothetical protein